MTLPSLVLRTDLLRPGDVILTFGKGTTTWDWIESMGIVTLSDGRFAHAALCVGHNMTFESDGGLIRYKKFKDLGYAILDGKEISIAEITGNPHECEVYRHNGMASISEKRFNEELKAELYDSYGKDYSELYRLIRISEIPEPFRTIASETVRLYESVYSKGSIPGPFCSELVSRFMKRLGLVVFSNGKHPAQVTPGDLSLCHLVLLEDAVVRSDKLTFQTGPDGPEFLSQEDHDKLAEKYHEYRQLTPLVQKMTAFQSSVMASTDAQMRMLHDEFCKLLVTAYVLMHQCRQSDFHRLERRAIWVCIQGLQLTSEFVAYSAQKSRSNQALRPIFEELGRFTRSVLRIQALVMSKLEKDKLRTTKGWTAGIKRCCLQRSRRNNLRRIRKQIANDLEYEKVSVSFLK